MAASAATPFGLADDRRTSGSHQLPVYPDSRGAETSQIAARQFARSGVLTRMPIGR